MDSQSAEEMRANRGSATEAGTNSPFRDRSPEENLDLFRRMKAGEFKEGEHVLRAKIDMASPNFNMRDPVIYRIRFAHHYRTGDTWCVYPMYDYTHCVSDALENITHSLCTLEFEDHRPLYDWFLNAARRRRHLHASAAAANRVLAPEPDLRDHEQAQAAATGARKITSTAGTTRACRPSSACGAAASRRRASG